MMAAGNEWNAEIRADARSALPFERIGRGAEKRRRWPRLALWGGLAVVLIGGGAAAYLKYGDYLGPAHSGEVPVVRADVAPIKVRPQEPGGMDVPNRDKLIYDQMAGGTSAPRVERLLPPPESPRALPTPAPAPAPAASAEAPVIPTAETPSERDVTSITPPAPQPAPKPLAVGPAPGAPAAKDPARPATAPAGQLAAQTSADAKAQGGFRVQIAAARTAEQAEQEWARLSRQHKDLLGEIGHSVAVTDLGDKGVFHRLRAGPVKDRAAAEDLCNQLKQRNVGCLIVRPD